jgi:methylglyoxal/glyoxal reductase
MDITSKVTLNNGVEMPWLGLGVFRLEEGGEVEKAVKTALLKGYRSIDTAAAYHNEAGVARGIKESGIPRKEIFITTKIKNDQQGYKSAIDAFYQSLELLQTDYIDLYLIHWPKGNKSLQTWKAMEELYEKGLIRAIGVSNFKVHHLEYLMTAGKVVPAVNQVEFHPKHTQHELLVFCKNHQIQLEAWSPLIAGEAFKTPVIKKLASKYGKSPAQIVLRWDLQKGVVTIPKSGNPERIVANAQIFDFEIEKADMDKVDALNIDNPLVAYRDKTSHLLQMIFTHVFTKQFILSSVKAFFKLTLKAISGFRLRSTRNYMLF